MSYLSIKNINKYYGKEKVLNNISFQIEKNEFISILGPSGCGKSTLLSILCGLESDISGQIYFQGIDITNESCKDRGFGIVFQNPVLFPNMTTEKNISYALKNKGLSKAQIKDKVKYIINIIGINDIYNKYPHQLSGGQKQRVCLARSLILQPKILFLDEPFSALDKNTKDYLRLELKRLHTELGITILMVTHDQQEAMVMSDSIVLMNKGEIVQVGTPQQIYYNPKNKFAVNFIGNINNIDSEYGEIRVRPENLKISKTPCEGYYKTTIKNIEFKGMISKILFESLNCELNKNCLSLDILSKEKDELGLEKNQEIYIGIDKKIYLNKELL